MKSIMKYVVRGFALLGFGIFMLSVFGWASLLLHEKSHLPETIVLHLDFTKDIPEKADEASVGQLLHEGESLALRDAVAALDLAAKDPRVKVIAGTFGGNMMSMAGAEELRAALFRARDGGKLSYAFAPSFGELGPADKAYDLASAFEDIWVQPLGIVGLTGFSVQTPFFRRTLEKIGAQAQFVHREEYKNAMESLTEDDYTAPSAAMLEDVLNEYTSLLARDIEDARGIDGLTFFQLVDRAPLSAKDAAEAGLIDHVGYADELEDRIYAAFPAAEFIAASQYLALRRAEMREPGAGKEALPVIAFIHAVGNIVQEADELSVAHNVVAANETVGAIEDAVNDEAVEAILLRLDSPGGSAVASESIRRAVVRAQMTGMPVIVSMGSMAASGGYWIASAADYILADEATLTGSIGVLAGKVAATELWEKLGISWGIISRGENADMWSPLVPFTDVQQRQVDALIGATYDAFLQRVAEGRGLSLPEARNLARGRVWTGLQAVENGLVDENGGLYEAIGVTKSFLGVAEDDSVIIKTYPAPLSFAEKLTTFLENLSTIGVTVTHLGTFMAQTERVMMPLVQAWGASAGRSATASTALWGF